MLTLKRSLGDCGGEYQSVMMTPPNGSAETSGMNATVSSDARHRKLLTPIPPPASAPVPSAGLSGPPIDRPPGPNTDSASSVDGLLIPVPRFAWVRVVCCWISPPFQNGESQAARVMDNNAAMARKAPRERDVAAARNELAMAQQSLFELRKAAFIADPGAQATSQEKSLFSVAAVVYQGPVVPPGRPAVPPIFSPARGCRLMGKIVWLASYPKSGNTWLRAFLHNLLADPREAYDINALHTFCVSDSQAMWYNRFDPRLPTRRWRKSGRACTTPSPSSAPGRSSSRRIWRWASWRARS